MPEEPVLAEVIAEQRELLSRLRSVVEAKDAENAALRSSTGSSPRPGSPSAPDRREDQAVAFPRCHGRPGRARYPVTAGSAVSPVTFASTGRAGEWI